MIYGGTRFAGHVLGCLVEDHGVLRTEQRSYNRKHRYPSKSCSGAAPQSHQSRGPVYYFREHIPAVSNAPLLCCLLCDVCSWLPRRGSRGAAHRAENYPRAGSQTQSIGIHPRAVVVLRHNHTRAVVMYTTFESIFLL